MQGKCVRKLARKSDSSEKIDGGNVVLGLHVAELKNWLLKLIFSNLFFAIKNWLRTPRQMPLEDLNLHFPLIFLPFESSHFSY